MMPFPPGRYVTLEGVELSPYHVLEVSSDFHVVHSRACNMDGVKGALICVLVEENAWVVTHINGKTKIIKEGDEKR